MRLGAVVCVLAGLTFVAACQEKADESGEQPVAGREEGATEEVQPANSDSVRAASPPAESAVSASAPTSPDTSSDAAEVERPASDQDTTFEGSTDPVDKARSAPPVAILRDVRAAEHPSFDRLVFEFSDGPLPGYHVEYSDGGVHECGSGREVDLSSESRLIVRLQPAQAHDDRGNATIEERRRTPALSTLKELSLTCDFEGQVEWVLGLAAHTPYRVVELAEPPRLVLDVRHAP